VYHGSLMRTIVRLSRFTMFVITLIMTRYIFRIITARSFCPWLLMCLESHHRSCTRCTNRFSGCVAFDGVRIVVSSHNVSTSLSLSYFQRSGYYHCSVLRELRPRSLGDCFAQSLDRHPPWLFSTEDTILSAEQCFCVYTISDFDSIGMCWRWARPQAEVRTCHLPALHATVIHTIIQVICRGCE
jgi:hypothetical protein